MIPFGPWLPDIAPFESNAAMTADGVVPSTTGFRPFPKLSTITTALTARAQGAISVRGLSGTIHNFCGDATKLYKLNSDGVTWSDVSRTVGGAYAVASDGWWDFTVFGSTLIATNNVDAVQTYTLDSSTNFTALGGTPPTATFTGTVRDFAVLGRQNTNWNRLRWSAINNAADWVQSSTTMSDYQDFPDGGAITGFVGGEYGLVFLERRLYRMAFEGPPTIFRFDQLSNALGCRVDRSIAAYSDLAFFLSNDGFTMIRGGSEIIPIGDNKIDRYFETIYNASYPYFCSAAIDPLRKLYMFAFPSNNVSTYADTVFCYHWPTGQWSQASSQTIELVYSAATQSGYTLDNMDSLGTLDTLPFSLDSRFYTGSGRLLLTGFDTTHKQGYFSGANLAATIETGDAQLAPGRKSLLRSVRPMIEGTGVAPTVQPRYRNSLADSYMDGTVTAVNSNGVAPVRVNARYHRAKVVIPAASSWTFAQGLDDINFKAMGAR